MKLKDAKPRHWDGHMEADYVYTSGIAGERFFRTLVETGKLSGTNCPKCGIVYVPPRMYCERCFTELTAWKELDPKGTVETFTVAYVDEADKKLKKPRVWAFIRIDGANGGLVHNLENVEPSKVTVGMKVGAVLKPRKERKGEITDILHFEPGK